MKKITHLLVDLDGTLVAGDGLRMRLEFIFRIMQSWRLHRGFHKHIQAIRQIQVAADSASSEQTNEVRMVQAFANTFQMKEEDARRLLESSIQDVFPTLSRYFFPVPGAASFIKWAENHFPLILATNPIWLPEAIELRVKWAGLNIQSFRSFTHAKRMHACKPKLEYYQELIEQEELNPNECLLIGNDKRNDLPAVHLGINVFLLKPHLSHLKPVFKSIILHGVTGFAWCGTYSGLRNLLERELNSVE